MALTDDRVKQEVGASDEYWATSKTFILAIARAIEAAACAERDARIAELEKECARLEGYWNQCLADCKNIAELERQLAEAYNKGWDDCQATHDGP